MMEIESERYSRCEFKGIEVNGLKFTTYTVANLPKDKRQAVEYDLAMNREPPVYYAWYDGTPMTEEQIHERVGQFAGMYGLISADYEREHGTD